MTTETYTQFFVRMDRTYAIRMPLSATVAQLKAEIAYRIGVATHIQLLTRGTRVMDNDSLTLSDYGVQTDTTLQLGTRFTGGKRQQQRPQQRPSFLSSYQSYYQQPPSRTAETNESHVTVPVSVCICLNRQHATNH